MKILQKAGVNFGIAGDNETCCGSRAYQMGYEQDFLDQAKKNMAMIKKARRQDRRNVLRRWGIRPLKYFTTNSTSRADLEVLHISNLSTN